MILNGSIKSLIPQVSLYNFLQPNSPIYPRPPEPPHEIANLPPKFNFNLFTSVILSLRRAAGDPAEESMAHSQTWLALTQLRSIQYQLTNRTAQT